MFSCSSNSKECGASSAKPEKKEDAKERKSAPATTKPAKSPAPAAKPTEVKAAAPAAKPEAKMTKAKK